MSALPSGTVTFLLTDIEGSTARWEQHGPAMQGALAQHDLLLRSVVAQHGGSVFKTMGDAFCAVFPPASSALCAALDGQRAMRDTDWSAFGLEPLRVRMALHTGVAELRNPIKGPAKIIVVAQLLATGHGGQILLSLAAEQLVRDELPPTTYLRDLGTGGLGGLLHAEHIFQLVAPDLQADFPPLKALDAEYIEPLAGDGAAVPNPYKGLRAFAEQDAADFWGREALTEQLLLRLAEPVPFVRFLAVVGPSGSGKSSVARAGWVPALRQGRLPGSEHWRIVKLVPGAHPLEELEAALLSVAANPPSSLIAQLREDERGLVRAAKRVLPRDETTQLLLVIDQFEEIWTLVADEPTRVHFLLSLHAAVTNPRSRIWVLITLRANFYDRPLLYPDPGELLRQRTEVVLPLSGDELERAIVRPAARLGVSLEPELLATIIRDVGEQPGALPLLQYALFELFERRQGRLLTLAAYRSSGGVVGALSRQAEEIYNGLLLPSRQWRGSSFCGLSPLAKARKILGGACTWPRWPP